MSMLPTVPPAARTEVPSLAVRSASLSEPCRGLTIMAPGSAHGLRIGPASKIAKKVTAYPRRTLGAMTCPGMEEKTSRCRWPSISTASAAELWSSDAALGAVASQKHSSHSMSPICAALNGSPRTPACAGKVRRLQHAFEWLAGESAGSDRHDTPPAAGPHAGLPTCQVETCMLKPSAKQHVWDLLTPLRQPCVWPCSRRHVMPVAASTLAS